MNSLPVHGRIQCARCFADQAVEFDKTCSGSGDWRITANPLAWGNPDAQIVVLGFSKGPTQAGALASAAHDEIAYKGSRANVGKILEYIGVLSPQNGQSAADAVSEAIANPCGAFHFGSLIRCTVERFEKKNAVWKGSGGGMLDRFVATEFGHNVALNCVRQHLANLPSHTKLVIMFGMGQKLNYVESAFGLFQSSLGGQWSRINDVAYTNGGITVVHVEHFASQGNLIPQWLDATSERGCYGILAKEAVALALHGKSHASVTQAASLQGAAHRDVSKPARPVKAPAMVASMSIANSDDAFSRCFSFVLENGIELFPVRMKNRNTGKVAFRVSPGGTAGNTKANGLEVQDEKEMMRYVLELGYGVRASSLDRKTFGLYKARARSVAEVRLPKAP